MDQLFKPYYAVIFTSKRKNNIDGYSEMADQMEELAKEQPGFLGIDSAHNDIGISVSYWETRASIGEWKNNLDHRVAQEMGKTDWYDWYNVKVCAVEREYEFNN